MKKLNIVLLLILFAFISCGKNEVVNPNVAADMAALNPVSAQMADSLKIYRDFVTSDKFVRANMNYDVELYKLTTNVTVSECFFDLLDCTKTQTEKQVLGTEERSETYNSEVMVHRLGNTRVAVRNAIAIIIDKAISGTDYGYGRIGLAHADGKTYYFDFNLPLSANPTQAMDYNTQEGYTLQNSGSWYTIN